MPPLTLQSSVLLSSGHTLPLLGFGVYQNRTECYSACLAALKTGYRHIDCAQVYLNEAEVGRAVRDSGIRREEIFVTSKIVSKNHGYESTLKGVEESLERMGLDYIDLFLIHDPLSGSRKRIETYRALVEKVQEGKLRSIGVSNFGVKHLQELLAQHFPIPPAVNQIEIHPFCQLVDITTYCRENNIVIQAYCPLTRSLHFTHPVLQRLSHHSRSTPSVTPAQILLRWSLQKGYVPLPKSTSPSRIAENADLYGWELSEGEMTELNGLDESSVERMIPVEVGKKKGKKKAGGEKWKRGGSVSWGGSVVDWREGDGL